MILFSHVCCFFLSLVRMPTFGGRGESHARAFFSALKKSAFSKWHTGSPELRRGDKTPVLKVGSWRKPILSASGSHRSQMPDVRTERDGRGRVTQPRGPSLGFEKLTSSQPKASTLAHRVVKPDRLNPNTDVIRLSSQRVRARETRRTRESQKVSIIMSLVGLS